MVLKAGDPRLTEVDAIAHYDGTLLWGTMTTVGLFDSQLEVLAMRSLGAKYVLVFALAIIAMPLIVACGGASEAAPPPTQPPPPTAVPPAMANKLILYGDIVLFGTKGTPNICTLSNQYKPGQSVGFRMTAIDPLTGKVVDTAELTVHVTLTGKTIDVPMKYRGTGTNPHPGMWTGKWVVPKDAPTGTVKYTVTGKDPQGRTGEFAPFQVQPSELTIVQ
jgi:hypothetical protein